MLSEKTIRTIWKVGITLAGIALIIVTFSANKSLVPDAKYLFVVLLVMSFFAEYIDSSLGMGYGTTLTPLLMLMGFSPLHIVPAVLLSESISGISAGLLHHSFGNVDLKPGTKSFKTMIVLAACSIVGTVIAVLIAVSLPKLYVKLYIGVMILLIGVFILFGKRYAGRFSLKKIIALGTIAAFNKGISGGGYGPLVTGGQVISGVPEKNAIGITSFAEGIVCIVGFILYISLNGLPQWNLAIPLVIGAMLSVPLATLTVKILPSDLIRKSIGYMTAFLGILTLIKIM